MRLVGSAELHKMGQRERYILAPGGYGMAESSFHHPPRRQSGPLVRTCSGLCRFFLFVTMGLLAFSGDKNFKSDGPDSQQRPNWIYSFFSDAGRHFATGKNPLLFRVVVLFRPDEHRSIVQCLVESLVGVCVPIGLLSVYRYQGLGNTLPRQPTWPNDH